MTISRNTNDAQALYAGRRQTLMSQFTDDDIIILPASKELYRVPGIEFPYRQDCNVLYLTGFDEPDSVVVLTSEQGKVKFTLFNLPSDPAQETWTGKRAGQQGAIDIYKADESYSIDKLKDSLSWMLIGRKRVHFPQYNLNQTNSDKQYLLFAEKYFNDLFAVRQLDVVNILPYLSEMRLFKHPLEIELTRKAIEATRTGHMKALKHCRPGMWEYELDAKLMAGFYSHHSPFPAYSNIVGSGENTCTLHYTRNDKLIANGDLVLIDAAAEYEGYAADITRTLPANGRFTSEQKQIYQLVLKAQSAGILATKPGATWKNIRASVARIITEGLVELGLLQGDIDDLITAQAYKPFYMHGPGHWVGLDVHDVGDKNKDGEIDMRPFAPGMVLTMEPGIYISAQLKDVPACWHNIGVRIEDMLLVTESGCEVLSATIPKSIHDIESVMAMARNQRLRDQQMFLRKHEQPLDHDRLQTDDRAMLRRSV